MDNLTQHSIDHDDGQSPSCEYLGKIDDRSLRYGYPNQANYCHRAHPAQHVSLFYQEQMCLTDKHQTCLVYPADVFGPLPDDIRGSSSGTHQSRSKFKFRYLIIGVMLILCAAVAVIYPQLASQPTPTPVAVNDQSWLAPSGTPSLTPPSLATLTEINIASVSTETILTDTYIAVPPARLETPFGPNYRYLIHIVRHGENIEYLAIRYKVSISVLRTANFGNAAPDLEIGQVLVILPGCTDPSAVVPVKAVYMLERTRIEEFVKEYDLEMDKFRSDNDLNLAEWMEYGQWVVITINMPTTTPLPFTPTHTKSPTATPTRSARIPTSTPTVTRTPKPTVTATLLPSSRTPSPTVAATPPRPTLTRTPSATPAKKSTLSTPSPGVTRVPATMTMLAAIEAEDYTVQSGDYLWKLAGKWGIDWQTLAALNNLLEPYIIVPGQVLKKPGITVTPTGTISAILIVPLTGGQYVVQPGDTLMGLAGMWGIPWQELAAYNGLQPPYVLYSGQFLKIPSPIPTPKLP